MEREKERGGGNGFHIWDMKHREMREGRERERKNSKLSKLDRFASNESLASNHAASAWLTGCCLLFAVWEL